MLSRRRSKQTALLDDFSHFNSNLNCCVIVATLFPLLMLALFMTDVTSALRQERRCSSGVVVLLVGASVWPRYSAALLNLHI